MTEACQWTEVYVGTGLRVQGVCWTAGCWPTVCGQHVLHVAVRSWIGHMQMATQPKWAAACLQTFLCVSARGWEGVLSACWQGA
jgi:hypothetical protein